MAATNSASTPTEYCELVLAGDDEVARGLVVGLQIGACTDEPALIGMEEELAEGSFAAHLLELVRGKGRLTHFVVGAALAARVEAAAPQLDAALHLRVAAVKRLRGGRCPFAFHAFTRAQAAELRALVEALPPGAAVEGYREQERVDAEAKGVEAYAPAHEYELEAEGVLTGGIEAVLRARRRFAEHALMKLERVELEFG